MIGNNKDLLKNNPKLYEMAKHANKRKDFQIWLKKRKAFAVYYILKAYTINKISSKIKLLEEFESTRSETQWVSN